MPVLRASITAAVIVLAVCLQVGLLADVSVAGVVPDLVLLVVVAVALVHGPSRAAVVGLLAGLVRSDAACSAVATVVTVAACAFVGASVFALSGLALSDPGVSVARILEVLPVQVLYDVAVTPLVLPPLILLLRRLEPAQEQWVLA